MILKVKRTPTTLLSDITSGMIVSLVALPLCLGIALASNAPLFSGIVAGIIGGVVVGAISGSHTSVSGPAAGLTAVVATQITALGSFQAFLLAVLVAGVIQIALGLVRAGGIAAFVPMSVVKGLLAAIGTILIFKQAPYLFGSAANAAEESANWLTSQGLLSGPVRSFLNNMHPGSLTIGLSSLGILVLWDKCRMLKNFPVPAPLVVVLFGVTAHLLFQQLGGLWPIEAANLVQVPVATSLPTFLGFFAWPDFSHWTNPNIYMAGAMIALVASLETLLNLEAVDKLDHHQRTSPPNRELIAQGVGNITAGLIGGLPVTSVVIRGSVNVNSGAKTGLATIVHGLLLAVSVIFLPAYLNMIPLSCLAAILLMTGYKLASPQLVHKMWSAGHRQFIPFAVTVIGIVCTDLLVGILLGLAVSAAFYLRNHWQSIRYSFARHFEDSHNTSRVLQTVCDASTPDQVLKVLQAGHERFRSGHSLNRDLHSQRQAVAQHPRPLAAVLSCIDSRTPTELILDAGIGDLMTVRIAGNTISRQVLGSLEYSCAVAGAKLILVLGHTRCGAVKAACDNACSLELVEQNTGCQHISYLLGEIKDLVDTNTRRTRDMPCEERETFCDEIASRNVSQSVSQILTRSETLRRLARAGKIVVVGAMYDVATGEMTFLEDEQFSSRTVRAISEAVPLLDGRQESLPAA